jgi:hypothetical protein
VTALEEWKSLTPEQRQAWCAFAWSLCPQRGTWWAEYGLTFDDLQPQQLYALHRSYCLSNSIDEPPGAFHWEDNWTGNLPNPTIMLGAFSGYPAMSQIRNQENFPFDKPFSAVIPKRSYNTGVCRRRRNLPP